uniref:restriction endonuclease subunit S n=1 Tax=Mitsuokella jalaludinii TaxID=187979 RepID=UPI00307C2CEC
SQRILDRVAELQPDIDAYDKAQTKLRTIEQRFPDAMKKSLLQYAIEGKLVPQRKEEGTAKDLLVKIRAEKAQLIKEKKIKKTKPLPAITDDEKPYAIPDSWEWRRLGDISTIVTGGTPSKSQPLYYGGNVPFYKPADIQDNKYVNTPKEFLSIMGKEKAKFVPKGSVAVNCIGNIGKSAILPRDGATNQQINSICYYIYPDYLYWFCQSMMFILQLKKVSSMTTIPIVNKSKVEQCIIPLPPLAEQHRIVAKLEELLPLCQQLAANP